MAVDNPAFVEAFKHVTDTGHEVHLAPDFDGYLCSCSAEFHAPATIRCTGRRRLWSEPCNDENCPAHRGTHV
jgi:hypothetical protein